jgi:hypothetical protein
MLSLLNFELWQAPPSYSLIRWWSMVMDCLGRLTGKLYRQLKSLKRYQVFGWMILIQVPLSLPLDVDTNSVKLMQYHNLGLYVNGMYLTWVWNFDGVSEYWRAYPVARWVGEDIVWRLSALGGVDISESKAWKMSLQGLPAVRPCRSGGAFRVIGLQWLLVECRKHEGFICRDEYWKQGHWLNGSTSETRYPWGSWSAPRYSNGVSWHLKCRTLSAYGADFHWRFVFAFYVIRFLS